MFKTLFQERLGSEFESRRARNLCYSIRAFAAFLRTDHSTLSQILRGTRRVPSNRIRKWATTLRMGAEEIALYRAAESAPDAGTHLRNEQLRQWAEEARSIVNGPVHLEMIRLSRQQEFRADCRWIAARLGVDVDTVNIALSRLLRLRLLAATGPDQWKDSTGIQDLTESAFLGVALERVRRSAGENSAESLQDKFGG
jgi:transcriptional regulator with XRE-family HTH domain